MKTVRIPCMYVCVCVCIWFNLLFHLFLRVHAEVTLNEILLAAEHRQRHEQLTERSGYRRHANRRVHIKTGKKWKKNTYFIRVKPDRMIITRDLFAHTWKSPICPGLWTLRIRSTGPWLWRTRVWWSLCCSRSLPNSARRPRWLQTSNLPNGKRKRLFETREKRQKIRNRSTGVRFDNKATD